MPKVTENLRRQWTYSLRQMAEERLEDQSGRPRSSEDIASIDLDMEVTRRLLALPLGTRFNAQDVWREVVEEFQNGTLTF